MCPMSLSTLPLPMASIRAIYGRDTHEGMVFPEEEISSPQRTDHADDDVKQDHADKGGKPPLRLV